MDLSRDQPVVFSTMFESMEARFGAQLRDPALRSKLRALGVDFDKLLPAYPVQVWENAMETMAAALFPAEPPEQQLRSIGSAFVMGFARTAFGKASLAFARVVGINGTVKRIGRNFKSGSNYSDEEVIEHGPQDLEVRSWVQPRFVPDWPGKSNVIGFFTVGVIEAVLDSLGAQSRQVELGTLPNNPYGMALRIRWTK